ncbi:hypothetical protein BUALT_Bualt07G0114100 [Buddleja alternifolia]|uniref:Uncharacterized protein n=1 Tax=Buddleja alternifolia TaxID=168488 RepID=A0AAV6X9W6_9LAMI|nr:hypothetical protein BUALT_Bualt07G0114100 [Buddleja alternifolia]
MNDFFDGMVDVDVSTISGRLVDEDNVVSKGSIDISTMSVPYTSADSVNTPEDLLFPNNMGTRAETTPLTTPSPIYQEHSSQVSSDHLHETVVCHGSLSAAAAKGGIGDEEGWRLYIRMDMLMDCWIPAKVLKLEIIVHSVIIGVGLGASQTPKSIKPLIAALTFHQFVEGIGLGGCITQAKFNSRELGSNNGTLLLTYNSNGNWDWELNQQSVK